MSKHTGTGNCWERTYRCAECGVGEFCDVCHEHDAPRGECHKCPPCRACEASGTPATKKGESDGR